MEESQEILLKSLKQSGVSIPENVSWMSEMKPAILISVCAQSLNLINDDHRDDTVAFLADDELSISMAEKFKICTDISSAIKNLGFIGELTYYKLLYPSEEDLYKLVRFLVERLSELSEHENIVDINFLGGRDETGEHDFDFTLEDAGNEEVDVNLEKMGAILNDIRINTEVPESSESKAERDPLGSSDDSNLFPLKIHDLANYSFHPETQESPRTGPTSVVDRSSLANNLSELGRSRNEEENDKIVPGFEQKVTLLKEQSSDEITHETEKLRNHDNELLDEVPTKSLELQHLDKEYDLLKFAAEMAFDDRQSVEFYLEQLNQQIDARKLNLVDIESKWDASRKPLEDKKRNLEESLCADKPEAEEKLQKFREVEVEVLSILSEIRKREQEHSKLSVDLEKQPKVAPRRSYIHRIMEITKNSRKLDADIERILKETREIQLEKNSIQERLDRTYAIIDEIVFREAKKDQVGRQAYRLLTSIHDTFEQISDKILATDRIQREVAEYEKKLAGIASQSLSADKLQADLNAIMKENESLEQLRST